MILDILAVIFSCISLVISWLTYRSHKRIDALDEKLKNHEVKIIEFEEAWDNHIFVELKQNVSKQYFYRVNNDSLCDIYDVQLIVPEEANCPVADNGQILPFNRLTAGNYFDCFAVVILNSLPKFEVTIKWKNVEGKEYCKIQYVSRSLDIV